MPRFSKKSKEKLNTCHKDLQTLFNEVVKEFDCTIVYGYRTPEKQFELYQMGRILVDGEWIIEEPRAIVTYKDGYQKKSKHNTNPSLAVDVVPYPIDWDNEDRIRFFAGYVLGVADQLLKQGKISHKIVSGFDWDDDTRLNDQRFVDGPHYQLQNA